MFNKRRKEATQAMLALGATTDEARLVARYARVVNATEGQKICSIGNWEQTLFVILQGEVTCVRADKESFEVCAVGVVGELSVVGESLFQVADVTCGKDVVLLELKGGKYHDIEDRCPVLKGFVEAALDKSSQSISEARDRHRKRQFEQYEQIVALQNWSRYASPEA
jgi:signal-transduction protein with cAMP-binding, CBS, and nucleotidyltransferase domain